MNGGCVTLDPANTHDTLRIFRDSVAIVTGGASGIGRALAEELAQQGCEVVLADLQFEKAKGIAANICAAGGKASAIELDVRDFSATEQLVQSVVDRTGRLDFMFNNAGIAVLGEARDHAVEDWDQVVDVNLRGVIYGTHAAYQVMLKQGFGHIVNTASMAGFLVVPLLTSYTATKYAVVGLSKSLRVEAAPLGVRVSVLCPGLIRTPIMDGGTYGKILVRLPSQLREHITKRFRPMDPNVFAQKTLHAVARNKAVIIVPSWCRLIGWLNRLSPPLAMFMARKQFRYVQKILGKTQDSGP